LGGEKSQPGEAAGCGKADGTNEMPVVIVYAAIIGCALFLATDGALVVSPAAPHFVFPVPLKQTAPAHGAGRRTTTQHMV
jgi:hypothetical protein